MAVNGTVLVEPNVDDPGSGRWGRTCNRRRGETRLNR
jgi:hypothetical protein